MTNVENKEMENGTAEEAEKTKQKTFLDFPARSFADYFTSVESKVYRSIQPPELLNLAWKSANKFDRAPNVVSFVDRFNNVSFLFVLLLLLLLLSFIICIYSLDLIHIIMIIKRNRELTKNQVSYWVATEICLYKDLKKRVSALKRFISIAHVC